MDNDYFAFVFFNDNFFFECKRIDHNSFIYNQHLFWYAILIFGSVIYFTANKVFPTAGKSYKIVFDNWFETFSSSHNAVLPYKWNAGIIGSFIYSFFTLLGKTAGIVFSFSLSILILVASILIFFISDIRFNLISFSKAKRDEARKILFNKKNSNLKVKTVYQTPKISQNVAKTESKIEDQLESDIAIKTMKIFIWNILMKLKLKAQIL